MGRSLKPAIPTVITGKNHSLSHMTTYPVIAIPFSTDQGGSRLRSVLKSKAKISDKQISAHLEMNLRMMGTRVSFQFRNEEFFPRSRKARDCAEAYIGYVAQAIPQIDAEIGKKGHFWMETVVH